MNAHDWELLDKQLHGFSSRPPQNSGAIGLVVVVMFLAGMAAGGVPVYRDSQSKQIALQEARTVISFLNDVPPTMR